MTREGGFEWYESNRLDFTYNRRCFLGMLKGLISQCKLQKTGFSVLCKKCGVCFDGAHATKNIVPRWHIALQPMYPNATCRLSNCAQIALTATKVLYFNNFCSLSHLPPPPSSGRPTVSSMRWQQGAYRSSPSATTGEGCIICALTFW
jgi:hypothetical protein